MSAPGALFAALLSTPATAGIILLVALVVLVLLIVLLLRSGEKSTFADSAPPPPEPEPEEPRADPRGDGGRRGIGALALRSSFRRAMARLDRHAAGPEPRYRLPWFLLAGEEGSRPPDMLGRARIPLPFGEPTDTGLPTGRRCDWWFLDRGVVLDLGGSYFEAEGRSRGLEPVLRLLQRSRPQRPLDGVVLTVSAAELHRAARAGTAGRSRLEERAGRICRSLWRAQRRLGLTLPVYVVVTDCDVVPGFGDFARALPEHRRREMLGWSSPYAVDSAYRGEWVDEAFGALARRLDQIQGEIFTDRGAGSRPAGASAGVDPDRVFVFPHAFATLAKPLRAYLDPVFRPSSYHESLILRGVYFSGALSEPMEGASERGPVLFLRDVLESKAFPEAGLGGPLPATVVARNRRLAVLQAAVIAGVLILGAGLWLSHARLERSKGALEPAIGQISQHVRQARIERGSPDGVERVDVERWTRHLLGSMAEIDIDRFGSPFLPSSWVSPFNRRLKLAIAEAYEEVVFEAMSLDLEERADDLTQDFGSLGLIGPSPSGGSAGAGHFGGSRDALAAGTVSAYEDGAVVPLYPVGSDTALGDSAAPLVDVVDTPEYEELRHYVESLTELESVGDVYNRLGESRDLTDLARVLGYLYGITLPQEFFDHDTLYREAQRKARYRPFVPAEFRDQAAARAETLAARLNRRLFADNELLAALEVTTTGVRQLAGASWPSTDESWRVQAVAQELRRVEDLLVHPGAAWAFQPSFDLGPGFRQVLARIETSDFLGPEVADRVRRAAELEWISYRRRLTSYSTELTGPLLALDARGGGQPKLSPDVLLLQANLDRFLDQSFVAATEPVWLATELPPGADLDWDLDLLRRAIALYEPYQRFRESTLPLSPPEVRPALDSVARERLGANLVALIAEAQSFEAFPDGRSAASLERRLRRRVAAFEAAAEPLSQLLALLDELGLWQAREDLTDLVVQQGGRLLSQVDHLLRTRDPYAPRQGGFGWWDGIAPAGLAAFDASNPEELAGYLQVQRQRLEGIARDYAEPLVTWLEQTGAASDPSVRSLVARWDGILAALDAHTGQKPGNSVGRLEEFIGQEIAELTLESCFVTLPANPTNARGDYFLESRERLRAELRTRCRALAADRAADSYAELSNLFNRRLAGRYPFADDPDAAYTAEAAPEDVEGFFRRFDLSAPMIREAGSAEGASTPGLPRAALDFVDEMTRVRRFFAPFLDAEERPPAPLYDVEVEFRVNRAAEVGGSQIIEWALEVGRERISNRSETLRTRWSPGEPVRLTLRWAADSPREPVSPAVPEVRSWSAVEGRTVSYEFRNRWSLLSALDVLRARPRDVEAYATLDPGTLFLAVDTRRAGSERIDPEPAEVYVRLSVLPPDGAESLTVPRFPARAPALRGRGGEVL